MAVDAAFRRTGNFYFVLLFFETTRTAGWKFHAANDASKKGAILRFVLINNISANERDIANTRFRSAVDRKPFRALEGSINDRGIELHAETLVDVVAHQQLRD